MCDRQFFAKKFFFENCENVELSVICSEDVLLSNLVFILLALVGTIF